MTAMPTHEITVRVRYQETDGQRRVHHANYLNYFEVARTEMLRASGITYRELEDAGVFLVVSEATCSYKAPADYDVGVETSSSRNPRPRGAQPAPDPIPLFSPAPRASPRSSLA